jgi:hypothetical protein
MIAAMPENALQDLCERGQVELMQTQYLDAARTLSLAENRAWEIRDFDTLSRLYLPLQEARRQIRQHCGEGAVRAHLFPSGPNAGIDPNQIVRECPHGLLLVGGWGTIAPALEIRRLALEQRLYLETFLGAIFPVGDSQRVVVVAPLTDSALPTAEVRNPPQLRALLPPTHLMLHMRYLPEDAASATDRSFSYVMSIWEKLHKPFLAAAAGEADPIRRMEAYRLTIRVDPACELAHQFLADIARGLARKR